MKGLTMDKKENKPEQGKQYRLTGAKGAPCIAKGNTWAESEVDTAWDVPCPETLEDVAALGLTIQELKELREVVSMKCEITDPTDNIYHRLKTKLDDLLAEVNHESKL